MSEQGGFGAPLAKPGWCPQQLPRHKADRERSRVSTVQTRDLEVLGNSFN